MSLETVLSAFASQVGIDYKNTNAKIGVLSNLTTLEKTNLVGALNELRAAVAALSDAQANAAGINDAALATSTTETYSVKKILEVIDAAIAAAGIINDSAASTSTTETYSASKISSDIIAAVNAAKQEIIGSAPETLNALNELAAALGNNPDFATDVAASIGARVRFDEAQSITNAQKGIARTNIGAVSQDEMSQLKTDLGDLTVDLVSIYNTSKT